MTLKTQLRLVAASIVLLAGASAQAQFISKADGAFDGTTVNTIYTGNGIAGWTINAGTEVAIRTPDKAARLQEGEAFAAILQPNSFTGISPNFAYDLSFNYSGSNNKGPLASASFSDTTIGFWKIVSGSTPFSNLVGAGAADAGSWGNDAVAGSGTFGTLTEATGGSFSGKVTLGGTTNYSQLYLVFQAYNNGAPAVSSLSIDNVSAVPEPESYAMFLAGLGAIGFMSRRRRNQG